mgnify:CR=1 FL=1
MEKGLKFTKWSSRFDKVKILNLIKEGKNFKEISSILEIPTRRFGEMMKSNDMSFETRGYLIPKNNNFFESIDSEIKAYLLGYTLADGCVLIEPKRKKGVIYSYSKRLAFCVSIDDREVINLLKDNISSVSNIREFHCSIGAINRKRQLSLKFASSKIVDDLIKLGINPNKTYESDFQFNFENIDTSLIRHFIRGFFDGDGSYRVGTLSFISTSLPFLKQIEEYFKLEIPSITSRIRSSKGKTIDYHQLHFNTGKGVEKEVYDLLYQNSNYYLQRKKVKFKVNSELTE